MAQTPLHLHTYRSGRTGCQTYARVTIVDTVGDSARAYPRHGIAALDGITSAHVEWG